MKINYFAVLLFVLILGFSLAKVMDKTILQLLILSCKTT